MRVVLNGKWAPNWLTGAYCLALTNLWTTECNNTPVWLDFWRCPICPSEIPQRHWSVKLHFSQAAALVWSKTDELLGAKKNLSLSSLSFWWNQQSRWNLSLIEIQCWTMTQGCVLPYFWTMYCPVVSYVFTAGKAAIYTLGWRGTMEQIPWVIFCCLPGSGKALSDLQLFLELTVNCRW